MRIAKMKKYPKYLWEKSDSTEEDFINARDVNLFLLKIVFIGD